MNVSVITGHLSSKGGGVATAINSLFRGRLNDEFSLTLHCRDLPDHLVSELTYSVYGTIGPTSFGYAPALHKDLRRAAPKLLHSHGIWSHASAVVSTYRRRMNVPVVVTPHGMLDDWALRSNGLRKKVARALFENSNIGGASCVHALTTSEAAAIRRAGFRTPVAVIPNGVDRCISRQSSGGAPWPAACDRQVLLFLGRIHPKKGLETLVRSWARAVARSPALRREWRLVIAGWDDGGHQRSLEVLIRSLGLSNDVAVVGPYFGAAKHSALSHAGAFVLPSLSEGLPMAVLEAWSYELPVFMTGACNLSGAFAHGAAVEVFTDAGATASVFEAQLLRPELLQLIGARGAALAKANYDWCILRGAWTELYHWLTGHCSRPTFVEN